MSGWTSKSAKVSSGATGAAAVSVTVSAAVSVTVVSGASVATPASAGISWGWVMGISRSARAPRLCGSSVARDGPIGDCQGRWVALADACGLHRCAGSASTTWANHRADRAPSCPAQSTGMRANTRTPSLDWAHE